MLKTTEIVVEMGTSKESWEGAVDTIWRGSIHSGNEAASESLMALLPQENEMMQINPAKIDAKKRIRRVLFGTLDSTVSYQFQVNVNVVAKY